MASPRLGVKHCATEVPPKVPPRLQRWLCWVWGTPLVPPRPFTEGGLCCLASLEDPHFATDGSPHLAVSKNEVGMGSSSAPAARLPKREAGAASLGPHQCFRPRQSRAVWFDRPQHFVPSGLIGTLHAWKSPFGQGSRQEP